jgi:hypothetical protein
MFLLKGLGDDPWASTSSGDSSGTDPSSIGDSISNAISSIFGSAQSVGASIVGAAPTLPPASGSAGTPGVNTATPGVQALQTALNNLGRATQRPQIACPVTGKVDDATVAAVVAGMGILTEQLSTWQYLALQAAFVAGSATSKAKEAVAIAAPQLTIAANTAAVKYGKVNPVAVGPLGFFAPGWYKTPAGLLLIGVGGFLFYKFVIAKPAKAAA